MALAALTGASGLLGANLAVELLAQGHRVRATRRAGSKVSQLAGRDIEWVSAELGDPASLAQAFAGADVVFHCAAQVTVLRKVTPELRAVNVGGTQNVVAAVRAAKVARLVHCSSSVAVGLSEDGRSCTEESPWNFDRYRLDDGYCITKHEAELAVLGAVKQGGLDAVVVNPTYMFGPMDVRPSSGKLLLEVARRRTPGKSTGFNNFVDVRDVARGMVLAWHKGRSGERYILGGENLEYGELMTRVAKVAGVPPPRLYIPRALAAPIGWLGDLQGLLSSREPLLSSIKIDYAYCKRFIVSSDKARRELGYTTGPLEVAVRDALAWFKGAGMYAPA